MSGLSWGRYCSGTWTTATVDSKSMISKMVEPLLTFSPTFTERRVMVPLMGARTSVYSSWRLAVSADSWRWFKSNFALRNACSLMRLSL